MREPPIAIGTAVATLCRVVESISSSELKGEHMYHVSIKLRSQEGSLMHGSIYEIPGAFDPHNIDRLRIDRIGYARASEYSAITGVPYLYTGYELLDYKVKCSDRRKKQPYWVALPLWPIEDLLAESYC
jgi:hypothetical protein